MWYRMSEMSEMSQREGDIARVCICWGCSALFSRESNLGMDCVAGGCVIVSQ